MHYNNKRHAFSCSKHLSNYKHKIKWRQFFKNMRTRLQCSL